MSDIALVMSFSKICTRVYSGSGLLKKLYKLGRNLYTSMSICKFIFIRHLRKCKVQRMRCKFVPLFPIKFYANASSAEEKGKRRCRIKALIFLNVRVIAIQWQLVVTEKLGKISKRRTTDNSVFLIYINI